MPYPEYLVAPMRRELVDLGVAGVPHAPKTLTTSSSRPAW